MQKCVAYYGLSDIRFEFKPCKLEKYYIKVDIDPKPQTRHRCSICAYIVRTHLLTFLNYHNDCKSVVWFCNSIDWSTSVSNFVRFNISDDWYRWFENKSHTYIITVVLTFVCVLYERYPMIIRSNDILIGIFCILWLEWQNNEQFKPRLIINTVNPTRLYNIVITKNEFFFYRIEVVFCFYLRVLIFLMVISYFYVFDKR